ncbi:MAG TPA: hypothetical protein PK168_02335 [Candidatus Paceibacterota bacterium]|jgi:hypothetical protein|nr:hypothetical protein [Candidatus Paceibacterota bacterium]HRU36078.1 hypothetical protein [Candidatus Paceibacterota bacterium]
MLKKDYLYGYYIQYDESAYDGYTYLRDRLDRDEVVVFLETAYHKGEAPFEDDYGRNYLLSKNSDGTYLLTRRD